MTWGVRQKDIDRFLKELRECGGSAGNQRLREKLGWKDDRYWTIQGVLVEDGTIVPGRGRGGSVRLTEAEGGTDPEPSGVTPAPDGDGVAAQEAALLTERDFYAPLAATLKRTWLRRFGFDDFLVVETHSQGSKKTGGTYTRPDLTVAAIRRYIYLPSTLEILTFEVKKPADVDIRAVLEAIAHKEAAHRSYVVYTVSGTGFEPLPEAERILLLAQKYGVGVLAVEKPEDSDTWEILLDAPRHEPDPARLDRFLGDLPDDNAKKQLAKWKE